MSTRDKSDFGAGKILPDELPDATAPDDASGPAGDDGVVHPERDWATGPDIAAAEHATASTVESGAHFRADEGGDTPREPVEPPHPPKHARSADSA